MGDANQQATLEAFLEGLSHLPLVERVLLVVQKARTMGADAFARRADYLATASGGAAAAIYSLQLVREEGIFIAHTLGHPDSDATDVVASSLRVNGQQYIDSDSKVDPWCDDGTSEDPRALPWPIVMGAGDTFSFQVTGSGLDTTGIPVRGFHVDAQTAEVFRLVGEFCVEGFNKTHAVAAVMEDQALDRTYQNVPKEITHIVATETKTSTPVLSAFQLTCKGIKLVPKGSAVLPPKSLRKPGSRVSIAMKAGDSVQVYQRYTGDNVDDAAKLEINVLGRRRYKHASC